MTRVPAPPTWLTRDSFEGQLEDIVDVWSAAPNRHDDHEGGFIEWRDPSPLGLDFHIQSLSIVEASKRFRTLPGTDRECVRIGNAL